MKNKVILDTSYISALYNTLDANHSKARNLASRVENQVAILIPTVVLIELSMFTKDLIKSKRLVDFAIDLSDKSIEISAHDIELFKKFVTLLERKLTTVDSIVLFVALRESATLLTFDKKLELEFTSLVNNKKKYLF